jgi:hypothetical protein
MLHSCKSLEEELFGIHWRWPGLCMMRAAPGEKSGQIHEEDSPFPIVNSHSRLECKGIWGGIRNCDIEVSARKVSGSIYSEACEGGKGGDSYYFGVCRGDIITRLAIADVTGHGEAFSEVSQYVYDALKTHR